MRGSLNAKRDRDRRVSERWAEVQAQCNGERTTKVQEHMFRAYYGDLLTVADQVEGIAHEVHEMRREAGERDERKLWARLDARERVGVATVGVTAGGGGIFALIHAIVQSL